MRENRFNAYKVLTNKQQVRVSLVIVVTGLVLGALIGIAADKVKGKNEWAELQTVQNNLSGEWTAELRRDTPGKVQMSFHRRSENGGFNMSSDSISLTELQGLTTDAAFSPKANVSFNIVRDAGTFACEGYFREGRGAGFWTFTVNQNFASAMKGRGYNNLSEEDFLRAAMNNLTTKYIEDLKSAGYDRLEFQQLIRAVNHDITLNYIRELQSAGFQGLTMEELIRASNHEINGAYIKTVSQMGFNKQPLEKIIRLRNNDITQEFINQMRSAGFDNLSIEGLIRLKNNDITPEFVNGIKAEGFTDISAETAVRLKNNDVDREFIRRVKAKGFNNLTLEQIIRLHSQDIVK